MLKSEISCNGVFKHIESFSLHLHAKMIYISKSRGKKEKPIATAKPLICLCEREFSILKYTDDIAESIT